MTPASSPPHALNHVAYLTADTGATHRFYTDVLGCRLMSCVRSEIDPSTREPGPAWIHTFFAFGSGEIIAFFEVDGVALPGPDSAPGWTRHIAFSVESEAALSAWRARLKARGVRVSPVIDHEAGLWRSIYFTDPNGINLELTFQSRPLGETDAMRALELVRDWTAGRNQQVPEPGATADQPSP